MDEPETEAEFTTEDLALLIACAIVGLWLLSFWIGFDVGKDIAYDYFGKQG